MNATPDLTQADLPPDVYLLPGRHRNPLHRKAQASQAAITSDGRMLFNRKLPGIHRHYLEGGWPTHVLPHVKNTVLFLPLHGTLWNQKHRAEYRENKGKTPRNYEAELQMLSVAPLSVEEFPLPLQVKYDALRWLTRFNNGIDPMLADFHDWARGVAEPTHAYNRLGQKNFRNRVLGLWGGRCVLTGHSAHVEACHLKPHSLCGEADRMNPYNGIPLSPSPHKLYDNRKISFSETGRLLRSYLLPLEELTSVGIDPTTVVPLLEENLEFVKWHRENAFDGEVDPEPFDTLRLFG